jgi:hypothetical protein
MEKKRGEKYLLKKLVMKDNIGLIDLTEVELRENNGGFIRMLVISAFLPSIERLKGFIEGLREGYVKSTAE